LKPRLTVLTLAVSDMARSLTFYRDGLGLPTEGIIGQEFDHGAVVFIPLNAGVTLALYPRASLGIEAQIEPTDRVTGAVALGHNVASREAVDVVMAEAEAAGAIVTDPARTRFWGGYAGHFTDPDGHLWEVAWNPAIPLSD
jgi:catechol 2,3-dioxygenase-like lactoylglutathione lyase family enzyme